MSAQSIKVPSRIHVHHVVYLSVRYNYPPRREAIIVDQEVRLNARLLRHDLHIWVVRVRARLTIVPLDNPMLAEIHIAME